MKQANKNLHFKKTAITELNDQKLHTINGGTSAVHTTTSVSSVIVNTTTFTSFSGSRSTGNFCDGVSTIVTGP